MRGEAGSSDLAFSASPAGFSGTAAGAGAGEGAVAAGSGVAESDILQGNKKVVDFG